MPPITELDKAPRVPMLGLKTVWFQVAGTLCNLRCSHCFISCSPENDSHKMMTHAQVRARLDEAKELGVEDFYFTGGEPFLKRKILEILSDALEIGPCTVLTNGMLISDETARKLGEIQKASPHALTFRVSLDGASAGENDRIRGKGVFTKATQGIRNLGKFGFEPIITACQTDEKRNPDEFRREFETLARSLGQEKPRLKILPPLLLGALEKTARPYGENERVTDACFTNFLWENLQCSTSRMVTAEGVYVCPILIDEPTALMGLTLKETLRPFPLAYSACYTCRAQGLSCANPKEIGGIIQMKDNGHKSVTREDVRKFYTRAAETPQPELCCPGGYDSTETSHIPKEVLERSYGCGSPISLAKPTGGEVAVDLGCGAGIDVFIAAKKVGGDGRVIGVDMTQEMLTRALVGAIRVAESLGFRNTEFRHGTLEEIPVDSEAADLVTSNCVLNLSVNKMGVFQEIARILKHAGRFVIADIVSEKAVPSELQRNKKLWGECLSGALTEEKFLNFSQEAGFYGLEILQRKFYKEVEGYKFYSVVVRGWKFKKGEKCLYTGQFATYLGPYSQVSDDDGHAYKRGIPFEICTDTAAKLKLPPYAGQFLIKEPNQPEDKSISCAPSTTEKSCC